MAREGKKHMTRSTRTCRMAATMTVLLAIAGACAAEEKKVELNSKLVLPKPQFQGTPAEIKIPNLEPKVEQPPLMVPTDVINLAKGKPVTSSESFPLLGELAMVTDGDKEGRDGSYVELGRDQQWVQIDLGEPCELFAIAMWLYHSQARAYHDVVIRVSDDADFVQNVTIIYNNDHDNSSGFGIGKDLAYIESNKGRIINAKGARARYVRINTRGNTSDDMNHFTEVEIYGRAVK